MRAEPASPQASALVGIERVDLGQRGLERVREQRGGLVVVRVGAAGRLGDDPVDDAELEAVPRVRLERGGRLLRLAGVAPEDRGAALGRDDGVDGVLLHQHAVGDRDRDGAAGAALADHAGDAGDAEPGHGELAAGDPPALPVLLRGDAGVGAGRVDQRDDREAVAVGELHRPHRLAVALGVGHPEVPVRALADVPAPSGARRARPCGRRSARAPRRWPGRRANERSPWSSTKSSHIRST